jgi:hypothetical protein
MMHNLMASYIKEMSLLRIPNGIYELYIPPYYT